MIRRLVVVGAVLLLVFSSTSGPSTSSSGYRVSSAAGRSTTELETATTATTQVSPSHELPKPEVPSTSTTSTTLEEGDVGAPAVEDSPSDALGSFSATCYTLTGTTASGAPAGPGSIAVDPRIIPLGTELEVEGYGRGTAADTGGAIKGRRLDLWMTPAECRQWGRRTVSVRILGS